MNSTNNAPSPEHWQSRYASNYHTWHSSHHPQNGNSIFRRPLGLVETSFYIDGTEYGGRSDMFASLTAAIRHTLPVEEFRKRMLLVWATMRLQHVLLMSKTSVHANEFGQLRREFIVEVPGSKEEVLRDAAKSMVFMEDYYPDVDEADFRRHLLNAGRVVDPSVAPARLFVLPLEQLDNGTWKLNLHIIKGHHISDGMSSHNWYSNIYRIMNTSAAELERELDSLRTPESTKSRLPPAQEDLYPKVARNKARERWFWAILRVIRHVRQPLPPNFVNPLRRETTLPEAEAFSPTYEKLLDYSTEGKPPLNSYHHSFQLSKSASNRLAQLARETNVTIGAACFALTGLAMMELHEERYPNVPPEKRLPFSAGFPLNPRAFFGYKATPDSCMLAFCDGIVLPFLPSDLPVEGRFRLLARQANRQLRLYQKRLKSAELGGVNLEPHNPGRLLADNYLRQIERVQQKLPEHMKMDMNPQGAYPAKIVEYGAACGISNVGSTAHIFRPGMYDLDDVGKGKDFVADYRGLAMGVRSRENEFLVGSGTDYQGLTGFGTSFDGNGISEEAATVWEEKMKSLLEKGLSRL